MRIVDHIPHPRLKITVFKSGSRYIVKFDGGDHDYSVKLREGEVDHLQDLRNCVSPEFINRVESAFTSVAKYRLEKFNPGAEDHFDII